MAFTSEALRGRLAALLCGDHYLVGFSGGLDSTVLLHALAELRGRVPLSVEAIHVHHGLQPQADAWAVHCRCVCERLEIPFKLIRIDAKAQKGESPEAAAREARYRALRKLIKPRTCLLTAHQQDDQAETLLLQLLRGSGPAGLAAMPDIRVFGEGWHARPLLPFTRAELADYAAVNKLHWIHDLSNRDTDLDRNYIRHEVLSRLRARWPTVERTLSRAAALQAEATELLSNLAREDLVAVGGSRPDTLSIAALSRLSPARQRNVLRQWLTILGLPAPTRPQLERILIEAIGARWDRTPVIMWQGGEVRRYRDDLFAMAPLAVHDPTLVLPWDMRRPLPIPHLGITLEPSALKSLGGEVAADRSDITVRFRRGGERCRLQGRRHHHELKKLFQEAGVPPWERDRIPLIYAGERLIAVVGYWRCE